MQRFEICDLFADSVPWNQVTTLVTSDINVLNIEPESLTSLEELILVISESSDVVKVTRSWPHLRVLQLAPFQIASSSFENNTSEIIDCFERGLFRALKKFRYLGPNISSSDLFELYKANISVEDLVYDKDIEHDFPY